MESTDKIAGDIAELVHYIIRFCLRPSEVPSAEMGTMERAAVPATLTEARSCGLIPEAEHVTLEWVAESIAYQPFDVRAVHERLLRQSEELLATPERARCVARSRQLHFPGVLERLGMA